MQLTIAVISILVAVYKAMPRERQLDLALKIRILDWGVAVFSFLVILYLEFSRDFLEFHHLAFKKTSWPHGIEPHSVTPLILMVAVLWLVIRMNSSHLSASKIFKFQELGGKLLWDGNYAELLALLERNAARLFKIANSESRLAKMRLQYSSPRSILRKSYVHSTKARMVGRLFQLRNYKEKWFRVRLRRLTGLYFRPFADARRRIPHGITITANQYYCPRILSKQWLRLDHIWVCNSCGYGRDMRYLISWVSTRGRFLRIRAVSSMPKFKIIRISPRDISFANQANFSSSF